MTYPLEIDLASPFPEDIVAAYCASMNRRRPQIAGSTPLALLNPKLVVKFGWGIYEEEFNNQKFAHRSLDPAIVRVPRPVHFFRRGLSGYLVMEWMELMPVSRTSADLEAVAGAVRHIHSVRAPANAAPGPIGGGPCRGDRFDEDVEFDDTTDLENFLNVRYRGHSRRCRSGAPFRLDNQVLVLAHLDIAARNLGRMSDGTICVLDWTTAGFFPRWFDHTMMEVCRDGLSALHEINMFKDDLLKFMEATAPLTAEERRMKDALYRVVDNCSCLHFREWNDSSTPSPPPPRKKKVLDN
ncbi:hypothetical protein K461DRAFT_324802 [Myriangium duriaei CBS 260.36]|uniref:Aminoglycoside phosphotransferase domain-containing protein n=1 Tax=Myriangium duriaei CBS 260.36 TaxID=1168546 RepID=A0A9P4MI32_9PEZI|nr:hypothetical protein K461DRAFT_324802 [Myriangium duriaei CBS 260.36]